MIVITGMHRSGTSLTAQALRSLGAEFGPDGALYEADQWNENGYLERVDIVDLNSRLLTGVARTTGRRDMVRSQLAYLRLPDDQSMDARAAQLMPEVEGLSAQLDGVFVKDPRFCATLPTWSSTGQVQALVVALRHPTASVASLRRRNRLPLTLGHRFWRWHMERVLAWIDDRTLVVQQELLTGPEHEAEMQRIRRWLVEVAEVTPRDDAPTVLDRRLVHHHEAGGSPAASERLWNELLSAQGWRPDA